MNCDGRLIPLVKNPGNFTAWFQLGNAFHAAGGALGNTSASEKQTEEAIAAFHKATSLDPTNVMIPAASHRDDPRCIPPPDGTGAHAKHGCSNANSHARCHDTVFLA